MTERLDIDRFLERGRTWPILDVRTPAEFAQGHIPGAHNLPLFSDEERAGIGTVYKHEGRHAAMLDGLDVVGPKMRRLLEEAERILEAHSADQKPSGFLLHCWRGGMRSGSVAWLLGFFGHEVATLEGGYKVFRQHVLSAFAASRNVALLSGPTGSGKTDVLHALREQGEQTLDLEGLAHHKGSVFGGLGEPPQHSQEQFENNLATAWLVLDPERRVWIEDESRRIGYRLVSREIMDQMASAPVVCLDVPTDVRVARLVETYGRFSTDQLANATEIIRKRLGGLRAQQITEAIRQGDLVAACTLLLSYYDRTYAHAATRRTPATTATLATDLSDVQAVAEEAVRLVQEAESVPTL
ncbi:MAG: tRNA 2-selenouridine(34) synthase MnmH [Rhodothermales bacterium]